MSVISIDTIVTDFSSLIQNLSFPQHHLITLPHCLLRVPIPCLHSTQSTLNHLLDPTCVERGNPLTPQAKPSRHRLAILRIPYEQNYLLRINTYYLILVPSRVANDGLQMTPMVVARPMVWEPLLICMLYQSQISGLLMIHPASLHVRESIEVSATTLATSCRTILTCSDLMVMTKKLEHRMVPEGMSVSNQTFYQHRKLVIRDRHRPRKEGHLRRYQA